MIGGLVVAAESEQYRRRGPDHECPEERNDCEQSHQHAPENRRWQSEPPEHCATEPTLQRGHGSRTHDGGEDRIDDPVGHSFEFALGQGQARPDDSDGVLPVAQEIKQEIKGQQQAEYPGERSAHHRSAPFRELRRQRPHQIRNVEPFVDPLQHRSEPGMCLDCARPPPRIDGGTKDGYAPHGSLSKVAATSMAGTTTIMRH